jgi:hypothetical protein
MNKDRIRKLIRYILAEAGQDEDWRSRELGPIHILKYVYLADMYYAAKNQGQGYTGLQWKFHHFGPWSLELYKEIPDAVKALGGDIRTFESPYGKDGYRFSLKDDYQDDLSSTIPSSIAFLLRRDIRRFGPATNDLLHYVYTTVPMTHSVPGEQLDFSTVVPLPDPEVNASFFKISAREKKKQKKRIKEIRAKIAAKKEQRKKKRVRPTPPRYDEVFFGGVQDLDRDFDLSSMENHEGTLSVDKSAWGDNWRTDHDLS